jgi:hypothetical protein
MNMVQNLGMGTPYMGDHGNIVYRGGAGGAPAPSPIDAEWYLQQYPDVAAAIQAGLFRTPEEHWAAFGQAEGRQPKAPVLPPHRPGGLEGTGPMPQGGAAPDWVQAARKANAGMNSMPFVLDPQSLGTDQMKNGRNMYPGAARFQPPAPPAAAGGAPANPLLGNPAADARAAAEMQNYLLQLAASGNLNNQGGL